MGFQGDQPLESPLNENQLGLSTEITRETKDFSHHHT